MLVFVVGGDGGGAVVVDVRFSCIAFGEVLVCLVWFGLVLGCSGLMHARARSGLDVGVLHTMGVLCAAIPLVHVSSRDGNAASILSHFFASIPVPHVCTHRCASFPRRSGSAAASSKRG